MILKRNKWSRIQKLSTYARLDVLNNIERRLIDEKLKRFKESPIESFLQLKIIKFPNKLLYYLFRRQCNLSKEDELWFNFEGKIVHFGIRKYEKIINLNCRALPMLDMEKLKGRFLGKYF